MSSLWLGPVTFGREVGFPVLQIPFTEWSQEVMVTVLGSGLVQTIESLTILFPKEAAVCPRISQNLTVPPCSANESNGSFSLWNMENVRARL